MLFPSTFIGRLIGHIADRHFAMIRYYCRDLITTRIG